jgi:hypothetical protein
MSQDVIAVLFSPRAHCPCRELVLQRTKQGLPSFVLPSGKVLDGESPEQAASRIARGLGTLVPPALWKVAGAAREGTATVVTASIPADAYAQLALSPKLRLDSAEMSMCDAWVNPRNYELDFLYVLVLARAAH